MRSSDFDCNNLVSNGDFENANNEEVNNIFDGNVPSWQCFNGSADVVNNNFNWLTWLNGSFGQGWSDYIFESNWAFICTGNSNNHNEGFSQHIGHIILNDDGSNGYPLYVLEFDYSSTHFPLTNGDNVNMNLLVNVANDIEHHGCGQTVLNKNEVTFSVPIPNNSIPYPTTNHFCQQINSNNPEQNSNVDIANDITFQVISDLEGNANADGIFIDNVFLACVSECLTNIEYTDFSNCAFRFNPTWSCTSPGVRFNWDFGDGNTSDQEIPLHQYDEEGLYTVTLDAIDENGCCTSHSIEVICGELPTHCVCWSSDDEWETSMQIVDFVHGFNYLDPNGNEIQVLFSEAINTESNYHEILDELIIFGDPLDLKFNFYDKPSCSKGGTGNIDAYIVTETGQNTFLGLQVTFENVAGGGAGNFPWSQGCE